MLNKTYNPMLLEEKFYKIWEESGEFSASTKSASKPFTIMMPPPNVTGSLHMGHGLTFTLQDILVRFYRKQGRDCLWQPGTDHAGIATQMVVERQLAENNINRKDLGREEFLKRVWDWKAESGGKIMTQLRALGATADWERERFTMDAGLSKAVTKVFVKLYNDGLIYRDKRLVNWDPKLLTAVSDLEVQQVEVNGNLWHFKYPIKGTKNKYITVATTRPETIFGDTAVAVNPNDPRYKSLIGKFVNLPLMGREIPIIADEYSDMEKGSGAVKITPAHDFNDFDVGRRHNLKIINIFNEYATLNENVPLEYQQLDRFEARKKVVSAMDGIGLLSNVEQNLHFVPHGDRSQVPLEPWLTDQWYCDAKTLAEPAIKAVEDGRTSFVPKNWENTYFNWMRNIQPWCISRQLWWGHQIPAWFGPDGKIFVAETAKAAELEAFVFYGEECTLTRDEDVLDTWFSSALWPFSTIGWPEQTEELKRYYPSDVLVTGFDIIFFWVARMMMMGLHFMDDVPFHTIYIHALVRDEKGQKMSKSKGNVLDPLDLIEKYGTDALRFTLTSMAAQGRDLKLSESRIEGYRNFATKLWNASRYTQIKQCRYEATFNPNQCNLAVNKWIIFEVTKAVESVQKSIENYRFNDAAKFIYQFSWATFCDWYIEFTKPILAGENAEEINETKATTMWVLKQILNTLNPIMPYLSEELWENLGYEGLLINQDWPSLGSINLDLQAAKETEWIVHIITAIRSIRAEGSVPHKVKVQLILKDLSDEQRGYIDRNRSVLSKLTNINNILFTSETMPKGSIQSLLDEISIGLIVADEIDVSKEKERIRRDLKKTLEDIEKISKKISNEQFIKNAPEKVILENKQRLTDAMYKRSKLEDAKARLKV
ncbi:MAG: valine--tRNA ligase [Alphaproteobacteria bacterium]|nr:valine--tRNA ligase [Alphaproteobacteria bacterium]